MTHPPVPSHPSDLLLQPFMILISITIIIIIVIITIINALIINSTKDDIWDMNELFHKLTNFGEQSSKPC